MTTSIVILLLIIWLISCTLAWYAGVASEFRRNQAEIVRRIQTERDYWKGVVMEREHYWLRYWLTVIQD